jgi:hypothetical protein
VVGVEPSRHGVEAVVDGGRAPIGASCDAVAVEYGARLSDELSYKPFERTLLDDGVMPISGAVQATPVPSSIGCSPPAARC